MKYFIDTEFIEGPQRDRFPVSLFRKNTPPTIDLISIGIVAEDGREYYGISKDFNLKEAWNRFDIAEKTPFEKYHGFSGRKVYWLRQNVLLPIWRDLFFKADADSGLSNKQTEAFYRGIQSGEYDQYFTFESLKYMIGRFGKTNKEIAEEVKEFCLKNYEEDKGVHSVVEHNHPYKNNTPKFYAYYADYDWVAFCWLFGKMMDLPKGFPMYCKDLKQMLDEKSMSYFESVNPGMQYFNERLESMKNHPNYPKQENEHDALADARWNKKLYEFLTEI
jgi:hypothetical protein